VSEAQTNEKPDWLAGWQNPEPSKPKVGNPNWHRGMSSPNPSGRPRGIVDRRMKVAQRMLDDAGAIVDAMISKALDGDAQAAGLILSRCLPSLRSQTEKVAFDFDPSLPISRQVEQVLQAISEGVVAPDTGKLIIEAVQCLSSIRATEELEQRIVLLEAKQVA
jgi:hypothetical protein